MDDLTKLASEQNATLVVLSFLQADSSNVQYNKAVYSLGKELTETWRNSCEDTDGVIECDCNLPGTTEGSIADLEPFVELYWPGKYTRSSHKYSSSVHKKCRYYTV